MSEKIATGKPIKTFSPVRCIVPDNRQETALPTKTKNGYASSTTAARRPPWVALTASRIALIRPARTKPSYSGSYSSKQVHDAYDDGYDDLYYDGDYDEDRYDNDLDYATGVDDAMDDLDW